jgi:glucose-1-phosphate adenylyltransferase
MGVYVFNAEFLYEHLLRDACDPGSTHDFGRDVIPALVRKPAFTLMTSRAAAYWAGQRRSRIGETSARWTAVVRQPVLSSRVRVNSYATLDGVVLLLDVEIGSHVGLTKVVVDRGCKIPAGLVVGEDAEADERRFTHSEGGVTLITQERRSSRPFPRQSAMHREPRQCV